MTTSEDFDDPFLRHFQRDPLPDAGIRIILLTDLPPDRAEAVIAPLADHLARDGPGGRDPHRRRSTGQGLGRALSRRPGTEPSFPSCWSRRPRSRGPRPTWIRSWRRSTTATTSSAGGRPAAGSGSGAGWRHVPRRLVFAVPLRDVHSPCRLHRLEKLAAIPLQSASSFLDVEILAKATFFGHLIDEVDVPPLPGPVGSRGWWADCRRLLREPAVRARRQVQRKKRRARTKVTTAQAARMARAGADVEQPGPLEDHARAGRRPAG